MATYNIKDFKSVTAIKGEIDTLTTTTAAATNITVSGSITNTELTPGLLIALAYTGIPIFENTSVYVYNPKPYSLKIKRVKLFKNFNASFTLTWYDQSNTIVKTQSVTVGASDPEYDWSESNITLSPAFGGYTRHRVIISDIGGSATLSIFSMAIEFERV